MHKHIAKSDRAASLKAAGNETKATPCSIKVGLDVHASLYVAVVQEDHSTPKPPARHSPTGFSSWVEQKLKGGHSVSVVFECGCFGFNLQRSLQKMGARCYVITPVDLDERRTRVKTNGRDATALCLRLGRYLDGNLKELALVRTPTEAQEYARHDHRLRGQLVKERKRMEAQGRSLLTFHAMPQAAQWWRAPGWEKLSTELPARIVQTLENLRSHLLLLDTQIDSLTGNIEAAGSGEYPLGLGRLTAMTIEREVCDWQRFVNRRQPGCYAGLCPSENSTGNKRIQGGITKMGNPRIRTALVEAAWRIARYQPDYPPVKKRLGLLAHRGAATSGARKKAITAIARCFFVDLWRYRTGRASLKELGLKAAKAVGEPGPAKPALIKALEP